MRATSVTHYVFYVRVVMNVRLHNAIKFKKI